MHGESVKAIAYSVKVPVKARDKEQAESLLRRFAVLAQTLGQSMVLELGVRHIMSDGPTVTLTVPRGLEQLCWKRVAATCK